MAKKNKKEGDNDVKLALEHHNWIITPVSYTQFGKSFSLCQQNVMLQVSGKLQSHFTKYLDERRFLNSQSPQGGISKEDLLKMGPIRLSLSDLGVKNHYSELVEKINEITDITFHLPRFDLETGLRKGDDYMPIFSRVFVPQSVSSKDGTAYPGDTEDGKTSNVLRRDGFVEVTINVEAAMAIFDMSHGYFNHLEHIALFCNSVFTSRLYLLLMKYVSKGQMHPVIDYFELKDFLGIFERMPKSDVIAKDKYQKFARFRTQVLNVARNDMVRLCKENKIEIMLESTDECPEGYEPVYTGKAKRGNPDKIRFHIKRTPLGVARDLNLHRNTSVKRVCEKIMGVYPSLDEDKLKSFVVSVPESLWSEFKTFAYNGLPKAVERPRQWGGTHEGLVFHVLEQWLKDHSRKAVLSVEPDLFSQLDASSKTAQTKKIEDFPGKYAQEWKVLLSRYEGSLKPFLLQARHYGANFAGFMSIRFADRETLNAFNAACEDPKNKTDYENLMNLLAELIGKTAARVLVRGL